MGPSSRTAAPLLVTVALLAACSSEIIFEAEPLPDLSGSWGLTLTASPSSLYVPTQGTCQFDPVEIELTRSPPVSDVDHTYEGQHQGGRMRCFGFDEVTADWTRLGDTTIVFPPDTLSAGITTCFGLPCGGPTAYITLWGFSLRGATPSETMMSGQLSYVVEDSVRMRGSWTARR